MKKGMYSCLALAAMLVINSASGQNKDAVAQFKMLQQFKGHWQTDKASMTAGGKVSTFAYTADFITTADEHGLLMTEISNVPGIGNIYATNLIGVNPYDGKVHWFSVDNTGVAHEHVGEFTDSKHFSMVYKGVQNSREYIETVTIDFPDSNTLNLKLAATLGDKEAVLVSGSFHRKKTK